MMLECYSENEDKAHKTAGETGHPINSTDMVPSFVPDWWWAQSRANPSPMSRE